MLTESCLPSRWVLFLQAVQDCLYVGISVLTSATRAASGSMVRARHTYRPYRASRARLANSRRVRISPNSSIVRHADGEEAAIAGVEKPLVASGRAANVLSTWSRSRDCSTRLSPEPLTIDQVHIDVEATHHDRGSARATLNVAKRVGIGEAAIDRVSNGFSQPAPVQSPRPAAEVERIAAGINTTASQSPARTSCFSTIGNCCDQRRHVSCVGDL